jgi:hypothetical protein
MIGVSARSRVGFARFRAEGLIMPVRRSGGATEGLRKQPTEAALTGFAARRTLWVNGPTLLARAANAGVAQEVRRHRERIAERRPVGPFERRTVATATRTAVSGKDTAGRGIALNSPDQVHSAVAHITIVVTDC